VSKYYASVRHLEKNPQLRDVTKQNLERLESKLSYIDVIPGLCDNWTGELKFVKDTASRLYPFMLNEITIKCRTTVL